MIDAAYDCIVVGGGPAGSTTAALVAEAGVKTLQVEREKTPRFHIGESLIPETYWIFERLGVLERMRRSSFVKKYSVQFVGTSGKESQPFYFREHDPRECSQTWQVEREQFDQILWENAASKGAECYDETRVLEVLWDGERATGVRLKRADGEIRDVRSSVVVDASGQQTLIAGSLGIRRVDPDLRKATIWGYYRGAHRPEGEDGGTTVLLHTRDKKAWFWYIPLSDDITSVGVVADNDYLLQGRGLQGRGTPSEVFEAELENCPALAKRLAKARLVGEYRVAKEFSYSTLRSAGDGWVLVGDAWGFIDPIYSSGVFLALKSSELAADCIIEALRLGDTSAAQLGGWCEEFDAATGSIRRLIHAYYNDRFSFGRFMKQHPEHLGNLTDLLIGRVFKPETGEIFNDIDRWLERAGEEG